MTAYKRGDVVLFPFPFTDLTTIKQRPALVISSTRFNAAQEDVIVVAITSNITTGSRRGVYHIKDKELHISGLLKESIVRASKVVTIDQRLIRRTLGSLPRTALKQIVENLRDVID